MMLFSFYDSFTVCRSNTHTVMVFYCFQLIKAVTAILIERALLTIVLFHRTKIIEKKTNKPKILKRPQLLLRESQMVFSEL